MSNQNQNQNQTQKHHTPRPRVNEPIEKTNIPDLTPALVGWTLPKSFIENEISRLLTTDAEYQLDGFIKTLIEIKGSVILTYSFFRRESKDISANKDIPEVIQRELNKGFYKISDRFISVVGRLAVGRDYVKYIPNLQVYKVTLDIYKALGLLFNVDPTTQELVLIPSKEGGENSTIHIVKQYKTIKKDNTGDALRDVMKRDLRRYS